VNGSAEVAKLIRVERGCLAHQLSDRTGITRKGLYLAHQLSDRTGELGAYNMLYLYYYRE
jgi:hypothetical protein